MVRTVGEKFEAPYLCKNKEVISDSKWNDFMYTPKILIRGNDNRLTAVFSNKPYAFIGLYGIKLPEDLKDQGLAITALFNSNFYQWIFSKQNASIQISGGYFSINAPQILRLPYKEMSSSCIEKLNSLSKKAHSSKEPLDSVKDEINEIVYDMYELTDKEILIIEESEL